MYHQLSNRYESYHPHYILKISEVFSHKSVGIYLLRIPVISQRQQQSPTTMAQMRAMLRIMTAGETKPGGTRVWL